MARAGVTVKETEPETESLDRNRRYDMVYIPISVKADMAYYDAALKRMEEEIFPENRRVKRDNVNKVYVVQFVADTLAMKWISWLIRQGIECTYKFEYPTGMGQGDSTVEDERERG